MSLRIPQSQRNTLIRVSIALDQTGEEAAGHFLQPGNDFFGIYLLDDGNGIRLGSGMHQAHEHLSFSFL
jgi:hypothetical protein